MAEISYEEAGDFSAAATVRAEEPALSTLSPQVGMSPERRHRQIILATVCSVVSRASGLLLTYLCVSLAVGKLGTVAFGIWMTINSLIFLVPFADLGIGNGVVSYVSRKIGESRESDIGSAVASCFYYTLAAGTALAVVGFALSHSPLVALLFRKQHDLDFSELWKPLSVFFLCLGLTLPVTLVEKVQMGFQDAYLTHLWQILANLASCAALYYAAHRNSGLLGFVVAYSGVPVVVKGMNSLHYFSRFRGIGHAFARPDWVAGRYLLKQGLSFLLLQGSTVIGYALDNVILASRVGAEAVAAYDVTLRLFTITVIAELPILPLWGAFGEAMGRGDLAWVRVTFRRFLLGTVALVVAVSTILILVGPRVIDLWTHGKVHPPLLMFLGFGAWKVFAVLLALFSALLNHEKTVRQQARLFFTAAVVSFVLKFPLLRILGSAGVLVASVISFSVIYAIPSFVAVRRVLFPAKAAESLVRV